MPGAVGSGARGHTDHSLAIRAPVGAAPGVGGWAGGRAHGGEGSGAVWSPLGHVPRALPPPGPGELSLAALPHAGGAQPGRGPAAAPGPLSHLPAEAAAPAGLQACREVQGEGRVWDGRPAGVRVPCRGSRAGLRGQRAERRVPGARTPDQVNRPVCPLRHPAGTGQRVTVLPGAWPAVHTREWWPLPSGCTGCRRDEEQTAFLSRDTAVSRSSQHGSGARPFLAFPAWQRARPHPRGGIAAP